MQSAGVVIVAVLELAAGMQGREDQLERGALVLRVHVDGNAASVVGNGDRLAVLVQGDDDAIAVAVHRLVDRVVEQLPDEVMEAGAVDPADVHAGPFADRLQPFENGDVFRGVFLLRHGVSCAGAGR